MDRRLALAAVAAIPLLALGFFLFTTWLPPLAGYLAGGVLYWGLLALALGLTSRSRHVPMALRWPGWPLASLAAAFAAGTAFAGFSGATVYGLPGWALAACIACAVINGTLEEVFWRGALLPAARPGLRVLGLALGLFVAWHLALLTARGITLTGGAAGLLLGAAAFGALATALRVRTGSAGAPALAHVLFNIGAFSELAARNLA